MPVRFTSLMIFWIGLSVFSAYGQSHSGLSYRIMFYNTENLFDTENDTLKNDDEFLPEGDRNWDNYRFYNKLNNIAKVIIGVGEWEAPAIVGLCEIENRFVLNQLVYETPLEPFNYQIVHSESPDWRGIDVAMLYREDVFRPDTFVIIPLKFPFDIATRTRDILYVRGQFDTKDTVHILINHWPSRYGGYLVSQPKRDHAASILREKVDSLFNLNSGSKILIMGDFNDGPAEPSIARILKAIPVSANHSDPALLNLMEPNAGNLSGTLKYRESWDTFDQIIVSSSLLSSDSGLVINGASAKIYKPDYLLQDDERYLGKKPYRTFYGFDYQGGYSDHLPVYIDLDLK